MSRRFSTRCCSILLLPYGVIVGFRRCREFPFFLVVGRGVFDGREIFSFISTRSAERRDIKGSGVTDTKALGQGLSFYRQESRKPNLIMDGHLQFIVCNGGPWLGIFVRARRC